MKRTHRRGFLRKGVVAATAARSPARIRTVQELWGSFTMCKPKLASGAYMAVVAMYAIFIFTRPTVRTHPGTPECMRHPRSLPRTLRP